MIYQICICQKKKLFVSGMYEIYLLCAQGIYCIYYPENIVCRNDDTRCQPDCIPNVHLMQIHKYKYANTQIQIRKYTNTDSVKLAQRPNMQIQKLFPHPIYYGWCQPDCIPNVHLMQAPTKVATIAFSIFSRSWQYSTYSR